MTEEHQSWDAFWAEVQGSAETEVIAGVTVRVPVDVSMDFEQRLKRFQDSDREEDVAQLVNELFGEDVYEQWLEGGMTARGFLTALGWGIARAKGHDLSFREAYELMQRAEGNPQAPNREQRRAAQNGRSGAGGGQSKRTSSGSTGSRRRR
jgi:hypothetical protein